MPELYKGKIPIITARGDGLALLNPMGEKSGCKPRDYSEFPQAMFADPASMDVVTNSDRDAYYDEQEEQESSLEHLFLRGGKPAFVNLDQNGDGDCWAYSTAHAFMLACLRDNIIDPVTGLVPRLNPHFIATYLKRFNGGWCGASMDVILRIGCLKVGTGKREWPIWSHDTRLLTAERLEAAGEHKVIENVYDLTRQVYDQEFTELQVQTVGLTNTPAPLDFNEMSHSMCQVRWVRVERGRWRPLILNSWKNFGYYGLAVLEGMDADGAVAVRTTN